MKDDALALSVVHLAAIVLLCFFFYLIITHTYLICMGTSGISKPPHKHTLTSQRPLTYSLAVWMYFPAVKSESSTCGHPGVSSQAFALLLCAVNVYEPPRRVHSRLLIGTPVIFRFHAPYVQCDRDVTLSLSFPPPLSHTHIDTHKNKKEYVGSFSQHVHQHVLLSHFTLPALGNVTAQQKFLYNVHKRGAEKQKDKERLREREKERKKDWAVVCSSPFCITVRQIAFQLFVRRVYIDKL